jgi:uncharacterized membrane protein
MAGYGNLRQWARIKEKCLGSETLFGREGVILSAAKNPGESSVAASLSGPPTSADARSRQYVTVTATTWIASALLVAALTPPALMRLGQPLAAMAIAAFFSRLCHQRPDRVLYLFGAPTAICLRCLGIYAGAAIGGLFRLDHRLAQRCLGVALALNIADIAAESIGLHGNLPLLRLLIGATLGSAVGAMFSAYLPGAKSLAHFDKRPALH